MPRLKKQHAEINAYVVIAPYMRYGAVTRHTADHEPLDRMNSRYQYFQDRFLIIAAFLSTIA